MSGNQEIFNYVSYLPGLDYPIELRHFESILRLMRLRFDHISLVLDGSFGLQEGNYCGYVKFLRIIREENAMIVTMQWYDEYVDSMYRLFNENALLFFYHTYFTPKGVSIEEVTVSRKGSLDPAYVPPCRPSETATSKFILGV